MLRLTNQSVAKAIERARAERLHVRVVSAAERVYAVTGSKGNEYTVRFAVANGLKLGSCDCAARTVCKHLAAAAAVNIGIRGGYSRESEPADALSVGQMQMYVARQTGWML